MESCIGWILIGCCWKGEGYAAKAEPISATATEEVIIYGIPSLSDGIITRKHILCVGCVGTRLG